MAVQMTRAEYKKKYGVEPVLASSTIDTTPAPRRMTRAEYEAEFNPKPASQPDLGDLAAEGFMHAGAKVVESVSQGADKLRAGNVVGGLTQAGLGTASGVAQGIWAPVAAVLQKAQQINPLKAPEGSRSITAPEPTTEGAVSAWAKAHPDASRNLLDALIVGTAGLGSGALGRSITQLGAKEAAMAVAQEAKAAPAAIRAAKDARATANLQRELFQIENNYAPMRKANEYAKDAGAASRARIAETDVLVGAVDNDGIIRTKLPGGVIDKYKAQTIDGKEAVVRENLVRLNEKVNLEEVRRELVLQVNRSGLEGADLITALNGIKKEIAGLKLRADEFGDIELFKIHDAKINTTKNINYQTPPETATYRKAVARAHKTVVEDNTAFNAREVNAELGKYYDDIARLERLDGKRVKGGRLGKYTAQIAGNIVGGAAGSVGGAPGAALGAMIGGEVASMAKGAAMSRTFRGPRGATAPQNPVLAKAAETAKLPPQKDLRTPDARVGAPQSVPKTKEILKLEREIADNVAAQKQAIAKKDFTLVAALKEIYETLVARLKVAIKKIKTEGQRGFVKNPFHSSKSDKGPQRQSPKQSPSAQGSTSGNTRALDANAPKSDKGAWPTTASKPSKVSPTSIGSAPTGKEGVSARKADTSGPFTGDVPTAVEPPAFKGFKDLTTKLLEDLKGRSTVSKQYILDATNRPDLKQAERDLFRRVLSDMDGDKVDVKSFADRVKAELLPLKRKDGGADDEIFNGADYERGYKYENIALPDDLRGPVANYSEHVYESPIKTSAGSVHGFESDKYFAHTRIEDLPGNKRKMPSDAELNSGADVRNFGNDYYEGKGSTRRVIEIQSDLFQKGRLESETKQTAAWREAVNKLEKDKEPWVFEKGISETEHRARLNEYQRLVETVKQEAIQARATELAPLEPYRNTWWERVIREEVKQAAKDGKTKLQFPVGETAMKIEGLGDNTVWASKPEGGAYKIDEDWIKDRGVGTEVFRDGEAWIITDVLGDGKFKAVPKNQVDRYQIRTPAALQDATTSSEGILHSFVETFDISGKVDTQNPIYKFYEKDVAKYLTNKLGAKRIKDERGVEWMEVNVPKSVAKAPVEAFGVAPLLMTNEETD